MFFPDGGVALSTLYIGGKRGEELAEIFERCICNGALHYLHKVLYEVVDGKKLHFVHNDIHDDNVLYDEKEKKMTLIDHETMTLEGEDTSNLVKRGNWRRSQRATIADDVKQ